MLLLLTACTAPGNITLEGDSPAGEDSDVEQIDSGDDSGVDSGGDSDTAGDTAEDTGDDDEAEEALYQALFDPTVIQTVDIELSESAIRRLNRDGLSEYVEGDVTVNGTLLTQVGVRLKGSSTYEDLDCDDGYCKAAFKIKFNEFVEGQKYADLERLTLNNMTSDYTQSKEVVLYDLLGRASQLAPRASYARVTLNGEAWGLYANVESMDDEWLQRRFEDPSGNLWGTASAYADFTDSGLLYGWENKSGDGDMAQIELVRDALEAYQGDFFGELGAVINTDQWLDYWAWCTAIGNYDGYPFHLNDVHIYADPADGNRFVFMPWGVDESWDLYEYTGQTWNVVYGELALACLADQACVTELKAHILEATTTYDGADVLSIAEAAWALSEADAQTDPKRPFTPDYVWYYREFYAGVIPNYGAYARGMAGI